MSVAYSQEFKGVCVDVSVFAEYYQSLYSLKSFSAGDDTHVDETLGIVLRSDGQDTVSRCSDMTGQHSDVGYQSSSVYSQEVLLVNDHGFLGRQISVGYLFGSF